MRILLVDDDEVDRLSILREFERAGLDVNVDVALDGVEALERLREGRRPDLVLLDLNMPRCGGLEVLAALRADPRLSGTVVFVLTTSDSPEDIRAAYGLNAAGHIVKGGRARGSVARLVASYMDAVTLPDD